MLTIKNDGATVRIDVDGCKHIIPTETLLNAVETFLMDGNTAENDPRLLFLRSVQCMGNRKGKTPGSTRIDHRLPS